MTFKERLRAIMIGAAVPLIKLMGKIHAPYSEKHAIEDYYKILKVIKPMDVILSNTKGHLSNIFNSPGSPWKHAILYLGVENGVPMIMEAIGRGVIKRPLVVCLCGKDAVAVVRMFGKISPAKIQTAMRWARKQEGKDYDFWFDMEGHNKYENFYCTEFCYCTWAKANPDHSFKPRPIMGMDTFEPSDFYDAIKKKKIRLIFQTKKT